MRIHSKLKNREKGSALLIIMMMVIMLSILVMEISFSAQTAFSLAKNQIERAQMNAVAETGFAYAYNIVQLNSDNDTSAVVTNGATTTPNTSNSATTMGGTSIFSKADIDSGALPNNTNNGPPWKNDFQVATVGKFKLKLKINLEETKININRLINSEDKVDIRIRSALIEVFKKFKGTEEDVDRIIDYIDVNTLGQYETGALNGPAQTLGEILNIPNLTLKYSLEENDESAATTAPLLEAESKDEKKLNLGDLITVKSTGRININYASEEILKGIINGEQERAVLETILQGRSKEPFKTLNQLAFNKQFGTTFKKLANYLTVSENTFYIKVIMKANDNTVARIYYGYLFNSMGNPHYIFRSERIGGIDPEFNLDSKDIIDTDEPAGETSDKDLDETSSKTPSETEKKPDAK